MVTQEMIGRALAIVNKANQEDLYALTLVNRQFNTVTNPLLWRTVDIPNHRKLMKFVQGTLLSQHDLLQHVRSLAINCSSRLSSNVTLLLLVSLLPSSLENLELSDEYITNESFSFIPRQCPQLKSLRLSYVSITHQSMVALGQHCHQLRKIWFNECKHLSPNLFAALAACPLEKIAIWGEPLQAIGDDETARNVARDLVDGFPLLKSLCLVQVDEELSGHLFTTIHQKGNYAVWPNLTRLRMECAWSVEEQHAIRFIKAHPHVEELEFATNNFSDAFLKTVANSLPHLTILDLSGGDDFTARGIRRVVRKCPLLVDMDLTSTYLKHSEFPELGPKNPGTLGYFVSREHAESLGILGKEDMELIRRESQQQKRRRRRQRRQQQQQQQHQ
ncbi:unnamed protein product [Absidia cylindrospora]